MLVVTPRPPDGLTTPYLPQLVMTVGLGALAASALVVAVALAVRRGRAMLLAMLVGAAAGALNEAPLDLFVLAYYPPDGLWTLYESFGRPIPVWVLPAHMLLFATVPYLLAAAMRRWSARRVGWSGCAALALCDVLIEIPMQTPYYGDHPFRVLGFPMAMAAVNAATMTLIAVAVLRFEPRLSGWRQAWAAVLPLVALPAGTYACGFPVFGAVAAGLPGPVTTLAGVLSIGLALGAVHTLLGLAGETAPPARSSTSGAADPTRTVAPAPGPSG